MFPLCFVSMAVVMLRFLYVCIFVSETRAQKIHPVCRMFPCTPDVSLFTALQAGGVSPPGDGRLPLGVLTAPAARTRVVDLCRCLVMRFRLRPGTVPSAFKHLCGRIVDRTHFLVITSHDRPPQYAPGVFMNPPDGSPFCPP